MPDRKIVIIAGAGDLAKIQNLFNTHKIKGLIIGTLEEKKPEIPGLARIENVFTLKAMTPIDMDIFSLEEIENLLKNREKTQKPKIVPKKIDLPKKEFNKQKSFCRRR